MNEIDSFLQCINDELEYFKAIHKGEDPEKIFISAPLYNMLIISPFVWTIQNKLNKLFGIPVQPYVSNEYEYYIVERKGILKNLNNEIENILENEGATE